MITHVTIENFKSIAKLEIELGRVNVLIGENGCGKTNILEAIAFAAAAAADKLNNEFLALRGIRVTEPRFMRAAFPAVKEEDVQISVRSRDPQEHQFSCALYVDTTYTSPRWVRREPSSAAIQQMDALEKELTSLAQRGLGFRTKNRSRRHRSGPEAVAHYAGLVAELAALAQVAGERAKVAPSPGSPEAMAASAFASGSAAFAAYAAEVASRLPPMALENFAIFSPNLLALRTFQSDNHITPLGVFGNGLFSHVRALSEFEDHSYITEIIEGLAIFDWFERLEVPHDLAVEEHRIDIRDRYLAEGALFDQRSANEGFLFLLFYFSLFISPDTPAFFAIDNVDVSLNPKLCAELLRRIITLAQKHDKQVILTTHNPATLDGLNLGEEAQRLMTVYRDIDGHTTVRRIEPPKHIEGVPPIALSEAFIRGYIGGLPENF